MAVYVTPVTNRTARTPVVVPRPIAVFWRADDLCIFAPVKKKKKKDQMVFNCPITKRLFQMLQGPWEVSHPGASEY